MQAGVIIFGMQDDNDELYCEIANQLSDAYSSMYLSNLFPSIFEAGPRSAIGRASDS